MTSIPRILVTGAKGQLGTEIKELVSGYPKYEFHFVSKDQLRIEDRSAVEELFEKLRPNIVINCAAYTAVDKAESEPELAFAINGTAPGLLASACKKFDCRLIHVSTDYVFDGRSSIPYLEESATSPQGVYGSSKLKGEETALAADPHTIIVRTSWVYSSFGKNFVKTMLRLTAEKESISVVNDQYGSPTYAADLAEALLEIAQSPKRLSQHTEDGGIFHFSNEGIISWYEFALAIKELSGSKCIVNPIPTSEYPTPAKRPAYSVLDKTKIQKRFGIELKGWKSSLVLCVGKLMGDR